MAESRSQPPLLQQLAEKICAFTHAQVTPDAAAFSRAAILDTVGVTLAGAAEPSTRIFLSVLGAEQGPAIVFGAARRTSLLNAALINSAAAHALDFDDFSEPLGGHQSAPLIGPLFALAEARRLSGARVLDAYVLGVEVETRIARAVNFHHYEKGWHPTATMGVFGACAASAWLLGLDQTKTTYALAIAASLASGVKANFGTMTKHLHVGQCARNGLMAALLAEGGFDANPYAMEAPQGFLNVYNGAGTYDADKMLDWSAPLEAEAPAIGLKQFPCCGSTHPAVSAMLRLVREEGLKPEAVRKIGILVPQRRLTHTNNPRPRGELAAKFSVQYAVVCALLYGGVRLEHFTEAFINSADADDFLSRTVAQPDPSVADDAPAQFCAEVTVTLADSRRLTRRTDNEVGRGPTNPMSREELWAKFQECAERVLTPADAAELFDRLYALDAEQDISDLTLLMYGDAPKAARSTTPTGADPTGAAPETAWVP